MAMDQYSKLKVTFDEVTGAMQLTGQQSVSLQKQVRLLRQELTLGSYTEAQFKQIQKALQETEIQLRQTQIRGKDLLQQVGTLGGGIGETANRIDNLVKVLGALNDVTLDELKQQFKNIYLTITGQADKISESIEVIKTGGRPIGARETTGNMGEAGDGMGGVARAARGPRIAQNQQQDAAAIAATTAAIEAQNKALMVNGVNVAANIGIWDSATETFSEYITRTNGIKSVLDEIEDQFSNVNTVIEDGVAKIVVNDAAMRTLTEAEILAVTSGEKLIITQEGYIAAQTKATTVTKILTAVTAAYGKVLQAVSAFIQVTFVTALRTADIAAKVLVGTLTLLGAAIGGLLLGGQVIGPLIEFATGFAKAAAEAENLKTQLEAIKKVLNLDLADLKRRSAEQRAELEKNNATSAELRKKDLKDAKDNYNLVTNALAEAREKQAKIQADSQKKGGFFGVSKEAAEQQAKNVEDAANLVLDLEQKQKDAANDINVKGNKNIEQTTKEGINNRLKAIDAEIEQQIESRTTESKELVRLFKERNDLVDYLDKDHTLTTIEEAERRRIQNKKINDAIIEDRKRVLQAEADAIDRSLEIVEKGSGEEYELRRNLAKANRDIAMQEAKKDEKTRENNEKNANTKLARDLIEIDKMYWRDKMELRQTELNSLYEGTVEFYDKERELEQESYRLKLVEAKNNAKLIEALTEEHKRKLLEIDAKEIQNKSQMLERKSQTEFFAEENIGLKVREINKKIYDDKVLAENTNYEAEIIRAGTNNEKIEQLTLEHNQKLAQISAQRIETEQQINLQIEQLGAQFGQTLSNIGNAILADAQGRDEKKFKQAKKIAVTGVGIEKAAAIASIWTNNYIANAKARAAFFATGGQPFVTINTISAVLNTAATIAAAAQAMSAINGTDFQKEAPTMGKNYAMGGYIDGPRHSQGGVPIEAEGGEAIMTRGAVTAFAPLLSTLNQMGGGTSFSKGVAGQAGFDFPQTSAQDIQQPQITKTYVVENELTTMQQRQARLKDLSIL